MDLGLTDRVLRRDRRSAGARTRDRGRPGRRGGPGGAVGPHRGVAGLRGRRPRRRARRTSWATTPTPSSRAVCSPQRASAGGASTARSSAWAARRPDRSPSTTDEQWTAAFASVFLGGVRLAREVAAELGEGGAIAFVLSTSVKAPLTQMAISNGLRPGLAMVAKQLADELGPRGIRVNGLLPGRVATERVAELDSLDPDPAAAKAERGEDDPAASRRRAVRVRPCRGVPAEPRRVLRLGSHAARRRRGDEGPVSHAGAAASRAGCWARRSSPRPVASSQAR